MNTTDIGKLAESAVAKYLKSKRHKVVALNWRTRRCEIDIVSIHKNTIYFTEVKYRSSDAWGDGLSYITPSKLNQMHYAAETWIADNNWQGEALLQAAAVNKNMQITLIELI